MKKKEIKKYLNKEVYIKYIERRTICKHVSIFAVEKDYAVITMRDRSSSTWYNKKILFTDLVDIKNNKKNLKSVCINRIL